VHRFHADVVRAGGVPEPGTFISRGADKMAVEAALAGLETLKTHPQGSGSSINMNAPTKLSDVIKLEKGASLSAWDKRRSMGAPRRAIPITRL
jgi:hypothetical protein